MASYSCFNEHNAAPRGAKRIAVYNAAGERIGRIPLGPLQAKSQGERLYTFAMLADTHCGVESDGIQLTSYFERALQVLSKREEVEFICIAGDVVEAGSNEEHWKQYQAAVDTHANGKPVFLSGGNHEQYRYSDLPAKYIGHGIFYVVEKHGDLFIFLNCQRFLYQYPGIPDCHVYRVAYLRAIRQIFEENREKRCFVLHHTPPLEGLTDYNLDDIQSAYYVPPAWFEEFNMMWFHGHTHSKFSMQERNPNANYDESFGFPSVHIPSLGYEQECYIVDVYKNGIHLQGYDITTENYVPIATFWVDYPQR